MEWKKYILTTTSAAEEMVTAVLMENGIESFEVEDTRPLSDEDKKKMFVDILPDIEDNGSASIIFYMDKYTDSEEEQRIISGIYEGIEKLKDFVDVGDVIITESITKDEDWVNKWKEFFKPFSVEDILIRPTWEKVENETDYKLVIKIDPGTAFGTGLHETTQLCIKQLRKYMKNGMSLLDVGCGSGILSIIGRKLGAGTVLGIDVDEMAVRASYENSCENSVNSDMEFIKGNIIDDKDIKDRAGYECYDIVTANILADIIIPLSRVIASHIKPGGLFITSGIICDKEEDVVSAIKSNECFRIKEITRQNDWVNVTAERIR